MHGQNMILRKMWFDLIRFGFRLLYNELAWSYDLVSWAVSLGEWRHWQQAGLPFVVGKRVLELGHGPGHMLVALQNLRFEVVGLDLSPTMGRQAQRRTQRTVPLVRASAEQLPFATAVFDTILSTFPTNYIMAPTTLTAVARLLRPNGRLVIVPEGHLKGRQWTHRLIRWLFVVTGQADPQPAPHVPDPAQIAQLWQPVHAQFAALGFALTVELVQLPRSQVTVLVATKTAVPAAATIKSA